MIAAAETGVDDEEARADFRGEETANPPLFPCSSNPSVSSFTILGRCYPVDGTVEEGTMDEVVTQFCCHFYQA